ncbi:hypothetical protein ACFQY7_46390 [Actinomadura luteofluorescens]|uniref:hypothetical protein n=1 Tax=Actinomadura luteofluorescens TaxID=46163 RepID=UPI0036368B0A
MTGRRAGLAVALLMIVLLAVNLRPAIAAVGPLLTEISDAFRLSGTAAGALTTLPLAFFGSYGLLAAFLRRPPRSETLLVCAMALLVAGLLLRLPGGVAALFAAPWSPGSRSASATSRCRRSSSGTTRPGSPRSRPSTRSR